ncbi:MAG: hypothetical protein OQL19_02270, partial [Gammaproteobacteria bacterium]|nr:hypothetical protein [Gammaproteobacteria bacterium]
MNKKMKFTATMLTMSSVFLMPTSIVMADERPVLDDITMDVLESIDPSELLNEIELPEMTDVENKKMDKEIKKETGNKGEDRKETDYDKEESEDDKVESEDEQEESEDEQEE